MMFIITYQPNDDAPAPVNWDSAPTPARLAFETYCEELHAYGGDVEGERLTSLLFELDSEVA